MATSVPRPDTVLSPPAYFLHADSTAVQLPRHRQALSLSSLAELHAQQTGRKYAPIAPNPLGVKQLQSQKRFAVDDLDLDSPATKKKRSAPQSPAVEMTEEDSLLLRLKDEEQLTWKEIAARFESEVGRSVHIPALQMRLKRLRERLRVWSENDLQALKMAHEYWANQKFEIIAAKVCQHLITYRLSRYANMQIDG